MPLSAFNLSEVDTRIVNFKNTLYKVKLEYKTKDERGEPNLPCSASVAQIEIRKLIIPVVLHQVHKNPPLKLQSKHFLIEYKLTTWAVATKLTFEERGVVLESFPKMIEISLSPKSSKSGTNFSHNEGRPSKCVRGDTSSDDSDDDQPGPKRSRRSPVKNQRSSKPHHITETSNQHGNETLLMDGSGDHRTWGNNLPADNSAKTKLAQNSSNSHNGSGRKLPLMTASQQRDKTLIQLEDMAEEMKLRKLSQTASRLEGSDSREMSTKRKSFIGAAFDVLLTPIKKVFRN